MIDYMMYKIYGRKENKAFCYEVDNVEENHNGGYSFRDIKDNTFHNCGKDEIVENPTFTGKVFHGLKEIIFA